MTFRVAVSADAERQIDAIDAWWRVHRADSPGRFAAEVAEALDRLRHAPFVAAPYRARGVRDVHRVLLPVSLNHVYVRFDPAARCVFVLAASGAIKRRGPSPDRMR